MTTLTAHIPVIDTDRLILREPRISDMDATAAFLASERSRFVGGPGSRFDAWRALTSGIGWTIYDGFEGQGIAYEAALAARIAAARHFGLTRLASLIDRDNVRSQRLAERLGATPEREVEMSGKPCQIWRHPEEAA